jgi:hypothetical protein
MKSRTYQSPLLYGVRTAFIFLYSSRSDVSKVFGPILAMLPEDHTYQLKLSGIGMFHVPYSVQTSARYK